MEPSPGTGCHFCEWAFVKKKSARHPLLFVCRDVPCAFLLFHFLSPFLLAQNFVRQVEVAPQEVWQKLAPPEVNEEESGAGIACEVTGSLSLLFCSTVTSPSVVVALFTSASHFCCPSTRHASLCLLVALSPHCEARVSSR